MKQEIKIRNTICLLLLAVIMLGSFALYSMGEKIDRLAQSVESFPDHSRIPDNNLDVKSDNNFVHGLLAFIVLVGIIVIVCWGESPDPDKEIDRIIGRKDDD